MDTLVEKLANCINYFWRLSGFPDLSGKVFLITDKKYHCYYYNYFSNDYFFYQI